MPNGACPLVQPSLHDDRLAARLGEQVGGRLVIVGSLSAPLLRGLVPRTRGAVHLPGSRAEATLLLDFARTLGAGELYLPVIADRSLPLAGPGADAMLVVTDRLADARAVAQRWIERLPDHAPVLGLVSATEGLTSDVPSPDPGRSIVWLRRRPPSMPAPRRRPLDVSVLIPTYNRVHMLPDAVRSALAQDPPPLEVIVADDGSTDDVEAALAPFGEPVRHLRLEHRGMASAMNAALAAARGTLVAWLDDDDLFLPAKLHLQCPGFDDPGIGFTGTAHIVADARGRAHDVRFLPEFRDDELLRLLLRGSVFLGPTVMVRRSAYDAIAPPGGEGPYDPRLARAADYAMWLRLARRWRAGVVPVPLTVVRRHADNPLDADRAREIYRSVRASVAWIRDHVELAELHPPSTAGWEGRALIERARASIRVGLFDGARADLRAAGAAGVSPVRIACLLGLVALESKRLDEAHDAFLRALELGGDDPEALNGLGTVHWLAGKTDEAAALFSRAVERHPRDPLGAYNLGLAESSTRPELAAATLHLRRLARDLLARETHRSALYSPAPPLLGIDRYFAEFRRSPDTAATDSLNA